MKKTASSSSKRARYPNSSQLDTERQHTHDTRPTMRATVAAAKLRPTSVVNASTSASDRRRARPNVVRRAPTHIASLSVTTNRDGVRTRATPTTTELTQLALAGIDTTGFDTVVINALKLAIPLYCAGVGAIFIFGTIAKVAFPDKYDKAMYGAEAKKEVEGIDLDNLSEEDAAAVAALEEELRKEGKL
jgi:hypothetical protein